MDFTDIALRAVGAFYAFAGVVATRASITAAMIDRAIATISLEEISVRETARTGWLFASAVLTFAGGLGLAVQLDIAVWLFVASAVGQALYLAILAPLYFDAEEPLDASGRRGTINAFAVYLVATAFVLWAGQQSRLQPFEAASPAALAIAVAGLAAYFWYLSSTAWSVFGPQAAAPLPPDDLPGDDVPGNPDDRTGGPPPDR